jgi:hypothetical protein
MKTELIIHKTPSKSPARPHAGPNSSLHLVLRISRHVSRLRNDEQKSGAITSSLPNLTKYVSCCLGKISKSDHLRPDWYTP